MADFFDYPHRQGRSRWTVGRRGRLMDLAMDALSPLGKIDRLARYNQIQRVLVAGVRVPDREGDIDLVVDQLSSKHSVDVSIVDMGERGKFENINRAVAARQLSAYDWLLIIDDDVDLGTAFLDRFIALTTYFGLQVAMPAHRLSSFYSFDVTRRHFGVARETGFVEIGPITLLHREAFSTLIPFPELRWGWGLDIEWAQLARDKGWRMGVVDATPIKHLRPIAGGYGSDPAIAEARAYLQGRGVTMDVEDMMRTGKKLRL